MKKYNQFEIFRFIGAFSVLCFHTTRHTVFFSKLPHLLQNGPFWVFFFFLLSGFLLTYVYSNKEFNMLHFYKTRFFKFYPVYFLSLILLLKIRFNILYHVFLIQSWIFKRPMNYNSSAWYLSTLVFLLLLFPLFLYFSKNKYFSWFVICINLYTYYFYNYMLKFSFNNESIHELINYNPLMYIGTFTLGMLTYNIIKNFKSKKLYSLFILLYIGFLFIFVQYQKFKFYNSSVVALSFVPLIVLLFLDEGFFSKFLGNKFFVYLGSLSYSIYILHVPLYIIFKKFNNEITIDLQFLIYFILVFIISNLTKYFMENKYYGYLNKKYLK